MANLGRKTLFPPAASSSHPQRLLVDKIFNLYDEAVVHAGGLYTNDPMHLKAYYTLAMYLKSLGKTTQSCETLQRAISAIMDLRLHRILEHKEHEEVTVLVDMIHKELFSQNPLHVIDNLGYYQRHR